MRHDLLKVMPPLLLQVVLDMLDEDLRVGAQGFAVDLASAFGEVLRLDPITQRRQRHAELPCEPEVAA